MKILVIQLARLGDIFQSWPSLKALRREMPSAEIHLLVRERFLPATRDLEAVDQIKKLSTGQIFAPLIRDEPALEGALLAMNEFVQGLKNEKYDRIVNLTFSPFSSYLTDAIRGQTTDIRGYSRYPDGTLQLCDPVSAYFYGQVGVQRQQRLHVSELFAGVTEVTLRPEDWVKSPQNLSARDDRLVVHVGASLARKSLPPMAWARLLDLISEQVKTPMVLVGTPDEKSSAEEIVRFCQKARPEDRVGLTTLGETFELISTSQGLLGCDSSPIHMATLSNTRTFNVSYGPVNFWETGPKAESSRIFRLAEVTASGLDELGAEVLRWLNQEPPGPTCIQVERATRNYLFNPQSENSDRAWGLIQFLYWGEEAPQYHDETIRRVLNQIQQIAEVALAQVAKIESQIENEVAGSILDRCLEVLNVIGKNFREIEPLVSWFQTELIQIGPGSISEITDKTRAAYEQLLGVVNTIGRPTGKEERHSYERNYQMEP